MDLYFMLYFFIIYAFLGWCCEVIFAGVTTGEFVNRGFLNGPLCPIYGFGVILVVSILSPIKENILLLFLGSVILTSLLELVTGWLLEKLFHAKWWDYSDTPFNIGGYVCLKFSILWGLACMMIISIIHPIVTNFVSIINFTFGKILLSIFLTTLVVDIIATVQSILKLNKQLKQINSLAEKIKEFSNTIAEKLYEESVVIVEKTEELKLLTQNQTNEFTELVEKNKNKANTSIEKLKLTINDKTEKLKEERIVYTKKLEDIMNSSFFGQKRLLNAFPNLKHKNYKKALEDLKSKIFKK